MGTNQLRLFIASDFTGFTEPLSAYIPAETSIPGYRIRRAPAEQWHLTWAFLGDIEARRVPMIQQGIAYAVQEKSSITVPLQAVCWWPSAKKARLIACKLSPIPELIQLASDLSTHLSAILPEFKIDKAFNPHITLARLKHQKIEAITAEQRPHPSVAHHRFEPLPPLEWQLDQLTLYQSALTSQGATYQSLFTTRLQ